MIRAVVVLTWAALVGALLQAAGLQGLILAPAAVSVVGFALRHPTRFWGALCR